jgi:hypothetical protein
MGDRDRDAGRGQGEEGVGRDHLTDRLPTDAGAERVRQIRSMGQPLKAAGSVSSVPASVIQRSRAAPPVSAASAASNDVSPVSTGAENESVTSP